jgi:GntR family transcriptional regulator
VMEREGTVRRIIGRSGGIVVSDGKVERPLNCTSSLPSMLRRQGFIAETRLLGAALTVGDASMSRLLAIPTGDPVVRIRRVRLANGDPLSVETTYVPSARFPRLLSRPLDGSLYDLMRDEYGIAPARAQERVEGRLATLDEVAELGLDGQEVVLEIRRTAYDATSLPIEFAIEVFRAGRTRIRLAEGAPTERDRTPRVADPLRRSRRS